VRATAEKTVPPRSSSVLPGHRLPVPLAGPPVRSPSVLPGHRFPVPLSGPPVRSPWSFPVPPSPRTRRWMSTSTSRPRNQGAPGKNRTCDLRFRNSVGVVCVRDRGVLSDVREDDEKQGHLGRFSRRRATSVRVRERDGTRLGGTGRSGRRGNGVETRSRATRAGLPGERQGGRAGDEGLRSEGEGRAARDGGWGWGWG